MTSDWARPVVHWSITALDPGRQRAFYADLFNWVIGDGPFMQVVAGVGGPEPGPAGHIQAGSTARTSLYIQVADLRMTIDRAIELGGAEILAPLDIDGGPSLAAISDPEGNHLMLVQQ
jgi:uncharacterized protein